MIKGAFALQRVPSVAAALLMLANAYFVALMIPAGYQDGGLVLTVAICVAYATAALWLLVTASVPAGITALIIGLLTFAVLLIGGFLGQMGAEIGSPGSSNFFRSLLPYMVLQAGIVVLSVAAIALAARRPDPAS